MSPKRKRRKPQPRPGVSLRDKYLRQKFEITEAEYNRALELQGGHCKGCSFIPTTRALHVDHDHTVAGLKIESVKHGREWVAWPKGYGDDDGRLGFQCHDRLKSVALKQVRRKLLRLSVRGLVCWHCNSALKKLRDDKDIANRLSLYLWDYHNFLISLTSERNGFKQ